MIGNFINQNKEAAQIADLINLNNNLQSHWSPIKIMESKAIYFPITIAGFVIGSVAVSRLGFQISEIKHLVVDSRFRNLGIGESLVKRALQQIDTPFSFATVRKTNEPSLRLFKKMNFRASAISQENKEGVVILVRSTKLQNE